MGIINRIINQMAKIKIIKLQCKRCNHEWVPTKEKIYSCPKCHSPKWDVEKENDNK